jgi:uncharacterized protein YaiL (DUF2058 family)
MGSLADELMKANLVNKKQRKKAAHDKRVHQSKVGRDGLEKEKQEQRQRQQARAEEKKARDRQLEAERSKAREEAGAENRFRSLVADTLQGIGGPRRFCYVNRRNRVPFLEVNDDTARRLTRGELAIIETEDGKVGVVPGAAAREIAEVDPETVRFWNR